MFQLWQKCILGLSCVYQNVGTSGARSPSGGARIHPRNRCFLVKKKKEKRKIRYDEHNRMTQVSREFTIKSVNCILCILISYFPIKKCKTCPDIVHHLIAHLIYQSCTLVRFNYNYTGGSPIARIFETTRNSRYGKFALWENFLSTIY